MAQLIRRRFDFRCPNFGNLGLKRARSVSASLFGSEGLAIHQRHRRILASKFDDDFANTLNIPWSNFHLCDCYGI